MKQYQLYNSYYAFTIDFSDNAIWLELFTILLLYVHGSLYLFNINYISLQIFFVGQEICNNPLTRYA